MSELSEQYPGTSRDAEKYFRVCVSSCRRDCDHTLISIIAKLCKYKGFLAQNLGQFS